MWFAGRIPRWILRPLEDSDSSCQGMGGRSFLTIRFSWEKKEQIESRGKDIG
jgi:hypothetical protein